MYIFGCRMRCCAVKLLFFTVHSVQNCTVHSVQNCTIHSVQNCTIHSVQNCTVHSVQNCTVHSVQNCTVTVYRREQFYLIHLLLQEVPPFVLEPNFLERNEDSYYTDDVDSSQVPRQGYRPGLSTKDGISKTSSF